MIRAGEGDEARHSAAEGDELIERNRELGRRKNVIWNQMVEDLGFNILQFFFLNWL